MDERNEIEAMRRLLEVLGPLKKDQLLRVIRYIDSWCESRIKQLPDPPHGGETTE